MTSDQIAYIESKNLSFGFFYPFCYPCMFMFILYFICLSFYPMASVFSVISCVKNLLRILLCFRVVYFCHFVDFFFEKW